jgi:hypothetical protein
LLNAIGLTPGGSITAHIYTQTIHRATQLTTLFGRFPGIRTQNGQNKINDELRKTLWPNGRSVCVCVCVCVHEYTPLWWFIYRIRQFTDSIASTVDELIRNETAVAR